MSFSNKIKTQIWWWLGKKKPFIINDEYELELLFIDKVNNSAKIQIKNLKQQTLETTTIEASEVFNGDK